MAENKHTAGPLAQLCAEVRAFHQSFGHPVAIVPTAQDDHHQNRRGLFIRSECDELEAAGCDLVEQADAYIDIIYFAIGGLVELGIDPDPLWSIVHDANMAKLFPDGLPRHHPVTGKTLKPDGWVEPQPLLRAEVERQVAATQPGEV